MFVLFNQTSENMETLKIDNREFKGEFVPFYNNTGFNFRLESGEMLTGVFKQGYSGHKEFELPISFNFQKKFNENCKQLKQTGKRPKTLIS